MHFEIFALIYQNVILLSRKAGRDIDCEIFGSLKLLGRSFSMGVDTHIHKHYFYGFSNWCSKSGLESNAHLSYLH